jgi:hypothetical protein
MNTLKPFINKQTGLLIKQQHEFEKRYNLNCATKYILKEDGKIYAYNDEKLFFIGNYEVIGTVNEKTCYWRWGWANPTLPNNVTNFSKNMIIYGESKKIPAFINSRHKGKDIAFKFLVLSNYVNNMAEGYLIYKKPRTSILVYLLITKTRKSNISYKKFVENVLNNEKKTGK